MIYSPFEYALPCKHLRSGVQQRARTKDLMKGDAVSHDHTHGNFLYHTSFILKFANKRPFQATVYLNNRWSMSFAATIKRCAIIMSHKHRLAKAGPKGCCIVGAPFTILLCLQRNAQMLVFDTRIDVCLLLCLTIIMAT